MPTVMVFVHGGAWGSGQPWHYRIMVDKLAQCVDADAGVVVQYPVFPHATIAEQATSVYDAVGFLRANAVALRLPPRFRVVLAGHSSGANISALAILRGVEEGQEVADGFVGLAGVYDVEKHYLFEATRGLHEVSPMGAAAVCRDRFSLASPTKLVPMVDADKVRRHWPPTLLLHGQLDTTVPYTSSKEFAEALQNRRCRHVETAFPLQYSHVDPILHMTVADHTSKTATTVRDFHAAYVRTLHPHSDDYLLDEGGGRGGEPPQLRSKL
jgi:acetyl esterase/lipase